MKDPHEIISQLSPADALAILQTLAREDQRLAARIAEVATARLSHVDPEDLAFGLHEELEMLEVEEVWDRAGPSRHGYVDPAKAAEQMIAEVIAPYLAELKKRHALGMKSQANQMCISVWGRVSRTAISVNFYPESSILSLSKDAVLDPKRPFRDLSRFTDPAGSTGDKPLDWLGGHLSVTMPW